VVGVRSSDFTGSRIVRRDEGLNACRGLELPGDLGNVTAVGGASSGLDFAGFENGEVLALHPDGLGWELDLGERHPVGALFTIQYQGREVLVVLWMDYGGSSGEFLKLIEIDNQITIKHFDVSFSVNDAARAVDGSAERIATEYDSDGIQHYRIDPMGDTLATGGERQIPRPSSLAGVFRDLSVDAGVALITAQRGVMYWRDGESPAFLGPVACVWPAHSGGPLPEPDDAEYVAAVADRAVSGTFLVLVEGSLTGSGQDGSYVFRMSHRGECGMVIEASEGDVITDVAWSGI
jgi:hypothetical protein